MCMCMCVCARAHTHTHTELRIIELLSILAMMILDHTVSLTDVEEYAS